MPLATVEMNSWMLWTEELMKKTHMAHIATLRVSLFHSLFLLQISLVQNLELLTNEFYNQAFKIVIRGCKEVQSSVEVEHELDFVPDCSPFFSLCLFYSSVLCMLAPDCAIFGCLFWWIILIDVQISKTVLLLVKFNLNIKSLVHMQEANFR